MAIIMPAITMNIVADTNVSVRRLNDLWNIALVSFLVTGIPYTEAAVRAV